jgi:hypothetical protein
MIWLYDYVWITFPQLKKMTSITDRKKVTQKTQSVEIRPKRDKSDFDLTFIIFQDGAEYNRRGNRAKYSKPGYGLSRRSGLHTSATSDRRQSQQQQQQQQRQQVGKNGLFNLLF